MHLFSDYSIGHHIEVDSQHPTGRSGCPDIVRTNSLTVINPDSNKKDSQAEYFFASDARYTSYQMIDSNYDKDLVTVLFSITPVPSLSIPTKLSTWRMRT